MNCPGINETAAYLDGALSREEEAHWKEHFLRCAKCRKAVEELRHLLSLAPIEPGQDCLERGKALVGPRGGLFVGAPLSFRNCRPEGHERMA